MEPLPLAEEKPAFSERGRSAPRATVRLIRRTSTASRVSGDLRRMAAGEPDWPNHYHMLRRIGRRLLREI
jgi:hypothetical protein